MRSARRVGSGGAATSRFSSTVSRANSLDSWNVLTSPIRARRYAGIRVTSRPSKTTVPFVAGIVPASTAMNVDLPAPFGPISPVIWPRGTSSETPSTACMPSKWRCTSVATSIGAASVAVAKHPDPRLETFRKHLVPLRPHSLGSEPQEPQDEKADENPLHRRDEVRRADVDVVVQEARHLLEADRHQKSPEDGTQVVAAAADDDCREQDDGLGIQPGRGRPEGEKADEDGARKAGNRAADDEHGHLQGDRVLAEGGGGQLLVAHGAQRPAEGRVDDSRSDEPHERHADRGQTDVEVEVRVCSGVDLVLKRMRHQRQAGSPVEPRT